MPATWSKARRPPMAWKAPLGKNGARAQGWPSHRMAAGGGDPAQNLPARRFWSEEGGTSAPREKRGKTATHRPLSLKGQRLPGRVSPPKANHKGDAGFLAGFFLHFPPLFSCCVHTWWVERGRLGFAWTNWVNAAKWLRLLRFAIPAIYYELY